MPADSDSPFPPSPTESIGPPSYESSVAEKLQPRTNAPPTSILDEDGFLIYDEETFEAVANSYRTAAGPSSPRSPHFDLRKQPPRRSARPPLLSVTPLDSEDSYDQPPPFSPAGTSSSAGSEFGQFPRFGPPTSSHPNSPLITPPAERSSFRHESPARSAIPHRSPDYSRRAPVPSLPSPASTPRPARSQWPSAPPSTKTYRPSSAYALPLDFDPNIAYTDAYSDNGVGQASAFYNPLVAAHITGASSDGFSRSMSSSAAVYTPGPLRQPPPSSPPYRPPDPSSFSASPAYGPRPIARRPSRSLTVAAAAHQGDVSDTSSIYTARSLDRSSFSPSAAAPAARRGDASDTSSIYTVRSLGRPSFTPSAPEPMPGGPGPQWATSEEQLFRHVYGR